MRDEHVKDAAQNMAEDVTQDVAEGVLGAAEDGLSSVSGGTHVKDEHAKDAAQLRRALRRACHRTWRKTWASGPGRRAPSSHATTAAAAAFVHLALRWGRNWAAQCHLARAVGKRFRGCRAKRFYVYKIQLANRKHRGSGLQRHRASLDARSRTEPLI